MRLVLSVLFILFCSLAQAHTRDGLTCWMALDDLGATAIDSSSSGNAGTLTGTTAIGTNCAMTGCKSFNGTSDYITTSSVPLSTALTSYSVSLWAKQPTNASAQDLIDQRSSTGGTPILFLIRASSGSLSFFVRDDAGNLASTSGGVLTNQAWNFLTLTRSGNLVTFYVNGASVASASATLGTLTSDQFNIGAGSSGSAVRINFFAGQLDDVRTYNRVLTAQEILDLYNPGIVLKGNGTKFNY